MLTLGEGRGTKVKCWNQQEHDIGMEIMAMRNAVAVVVEAFGVKSYYSLLLSPPVALSSKKTRQINALPMGLSSIFSNSLSLLSLT